MHLKAPPTRQEEPREKLQGSFEATVLIEVLQLLVSNTREPLLTDDSQFVH